jgi:succinyl-diaminopimelate desuccinylase
VISGIVELAGELVRIPSQAGIDPPDAVVARIAEWLAARGIGFTSLHDPDGRPMGLFAAIAGNGEGPSLCIDACIDTAPVGDVAQWTHDPFGGLSSGGALWGRGAADSKLAAAILLHLIERFSREPPRRGLLYVLLDADEHTGRFGGVKAFLDAVPSRPDAMVLGYPGHESLVIGARGFLRCEIHVSGKSAHSGSINRRGINAIYKAAQLVQTLHDAPLPEAASFPLPPGLTVTQLQAGEGFSQVPDKAMIGLDVRLTPDFDCRMAAQWLETIVEAFDAAHSDGYPSQIVQLESWPAYQLDESDALVRCFRAAGIREFQSDIPAETCGPSNIGNLLSTRGVATICGLGVAYANLHAADESAQLADVPAVMRVWEGGIRDYLG